MLKYVHYVEKPVLPDNFCICRNSFYRSLTNVLLIFGLTTPAAGTFWESLGHDIEGGSLSIQIGLDAAGTAWKNLKNCPKFPLGKVLKLPNTSP